MERTDQTWFQKVENLHPYQTLMYLGMFGSGMIFLFLTIAFIASGFENLQRISLQIPKGFIASTFVLVYSSYSASKMMQYFRQEQLSKLKKNLLLTFCLGLLFSGLQVIGWKELSTMGIDFTGVPSGSFLYLLSGIHLFHLGGALVFAMIMILQYSKKEKDIVQHLLVVTNPFERMRIQLFTTYWIFMDLIWVVLFTLFVFAF
jgi:cytochrome c oxidase subunit III